MSRWRASRVADVPTRCDESGICELADEISARIGTEPERLLEARAEWATIVDIAPIVLGHLLALPFEHKLRAAQLDVDGFAKYWDYVGEAASTLTSFGLGRVAAVEHGSPSARNSMSCVRHCHTHVCPIDDRLRSASAMIPVVEAYIEVDDVYSNWQDAYGVLSRMEEYMLVRSGGSAIIGRPRSGIRQISRALLAALNDDSEIRDVDWVLEAENQTYFNTLKLLKG